MKELLTNPAFRYYLFFSVGLAFNPLILAGMTGGARGKHKSPASPEDAALTGSAFREETAPEVDRVLRAHRNALENVPIQLITGLLYVLAGASPTMVLVLMGVTTVFRWMHSIFYLRSAQPWRTISFALSTIATSVMLIHTLVLAIQAAG